MYVAISLIETVAIKYCFYNSKWQTGLNSWISLQYFKLPNGFIVVTSVAITSSTKAFYENLAFEPIF
jgi:hypothetical protein